MERTMGCMERIGRYALGLINLYSGPIRSPGLEIGVINGDTMRNRQLAKHIKLSNIDALL